MAPLRRGILPRRDEAGEGIRQPRRRCGVVDRAGEPLTGRFGGNRPADGETEIVAVTHRTA
jgi:hypothetical protein